MVISFINKNQSIPKTQTQEASGDTSRNFATEEKKYSIRNKVDSARISSTHSASFEDKRISMARSAILCDVTVSSSGKRLEELKSEVKAGTYKIPSLQLAASILNETESSND